MPILGPNIANLQEKRDLAGLVQALKSKDIRTRCAALHALGDLGDKREHFTVREAALVSLGKIGDAHALPDLEALVHSDSRGLARDAKQCVAAIRRRLNLPTITGF